MNAAPAHASPAFGPPRQVVPDYGRVLVGVVLISIGALFLLEAADVLDAGKAISDWWPAVIVAVGIIQLAERVHGLFQPLVLIVAGTVLLLVTSDLIPGNAWDYVWPTAIIVGGLFVISRWRRGAAAVVGPRYDDVVVASGIFGGPRIATASQQFRGGSLTGIFGGVELDLRAARPSAEGASLTATAVFGGVEILVPRGWRIAINATPIFGGVEDKTEHVADLGAEAPVLGIDCLAVFGGIEVKHEKQEGSR